MNTEPTTAATATAQADPEPGDAVADVPEVAADPGYVILGDAKPVFLDDILSTMEDAP